VHPFAVFVAYRLSKFYKVPFIFEVRDLYPQTIVDLHNFSSKNPIIFLIGLFFKFLYSKADRIIVLMPYAYRNINKYGIKKGKIIWIPNGVDLKRFSNTKLQGDKGKFVVMYVGAHDRANALHVLIKAAKIIQNRFAKGILFELIGNGKEKQNLIKLSTRLELKNVVFKDKVNKEQVPQLLKKSDALWIGQLKRNVYEYGISSNKLFDYLAAGKPIIFSSDASNNPVAEAGAGLTVSPEDPEAVAEAIIKLYNMNHSIPVLVDKLEKVIKEVCNKIPFSRRNLQ